jgi:hypothetical protein
MPTVYDVGEGYSSERLIQTMERQVNDAEK